MQDPGSSDTVVQVAQQTAAGQSLVFTISGTGTIPESQEQVASGSSQSQGQGQGQVQGRDNLPGGGLGVPIDAPDALQQYRWPILIGFALVLAAGGWLVMKRQPATAGVTAVRVPDPLVPLPVSPVSVSATSAAPAARSSMLLEALKEELFQLEVERRQGKSPENTRGKVCSGSDADRA
jgi:hypothetical protein